MKYKINYGNSVAVLPKCALEAALRAGEVELKVLLCLCSSGGSVDIKKLSKSEFLDAVEENDYDLALCSFYTTANDDLSIFFGNNAKLNYGDYTGESIDDLIRDAEDVYGEEEVRESYTALYDYLIENVPHISLYHRSHSIVLPSGISNVGLIRFKSVFTDINTWKKS